MKLWIPPPLQMIVTAGLMWVVDHQFSDFRFFVPGQIEVSSVLIGFGLLIEVIAIATFVRAKTTISPIEPEKARTLVVSGLYRFSRNPMYAGMLILLSGWALRLGNPLNVALVVIFVLVITHLQIKPEESVLKAKFGNDYDDYCRRVRRWV